MIRFVIFNLMKMYTYRIFSLVGLCGWWKMWHKITRGQKIKHGTVEFPPDFMERIAFLKGLITAAAHTHSMRWLLSSSVLSRALPVSSISSFLLLEGASLMTASDGDSNTSSAYVDSSSCIKISYNIQEQKMGIDAHILVLLDPQTCIQVHRWSKNMQNRKGGKENVGCGFVLWQRRMCQAHLESQSHPPPWS